MTGAAVILALVRVWLWIGAAVAAAFLLVGIDRIDEDARGAYAFRPLMVPGILLIWPVVLWRWWALETGRDDWSRRYDPPRRSHRWAALAVAVGVAAVLWAGLSARQEWPADIAPAKLEDGGA